MAYIKPSVVYIFTWLHMGHKAMELFMPIPNIFESVNIRQIRDKECGVVPSEDNDTLFLGNISKSWKKEQVCAYNACFI